MITIDKVVTCPAATGFYSDDQAAIRAGAISDGFGFVGRPTVPGMRAVRQPGEAVSVLLVLSNGQVAHGDCASVQYSGVGGRAAPFDAVSGIQEIEELAGMLVGQQVVGFREMEQQFVKMAEDAHPAVLYGVSQAILHAAALVAEQTIAEQVQSEYGLTAALAPVPVFAQSGDARFDSVDKMILREVDVIPHGLINSMEKLGEDAQTLLEYVTWVVDRVANSRLNPDYQPVLHFDLYGTLGILRDGDLNHIAADLMRLEYAAQRHQLQIEGPIDLGGRAEQIDGLGELRSILREAGSKVILVADEWCNDLDDVRAFVEWGAVDMVQVKTPDLGSVGALIDALLLCKSHGVGAYSGGTCNETDRSAQVTTNIAMACGATQMLAKPGMGVDEGFMIVHNEMNRVLALAGARGVK